MVEGNYGHGRSCINSLQIIKNMHYYVSKYIWMQHCIPSELVNVKLITTDKMHPKPVTAIEGTMSNAKYIS